VNESRTASCGVENRTCAPVERLPGLDWQPLDGEIVVYDSAGRVAHALSGAAAAVWNALDEATNVTELAAETSLPVQEAQDAIDTMLGAGILRRLDVPSETNPRPVVTGSLGGLLSRRVVLAGGAVGVTSLVTSVMLPSPAMAASRPPPTTTTTTTTTAPPTGGTGVGGGTGGSGGTGGGSPSGVVFTSAPPTGTEPSGLAFTGANVVSEVGAAAAAIAVGTAVTWAARAKHPKPAPAGDTGEA
jgi:hypothetical protein